jgi:hypothetical protein
MPSTGNTAFCHEVSRLTKNIHGHLESMQHRLRVLENDRHVCMGGLSAVNDALQTLKAAPIPNGLTNTVEAFTLPRLRM